MIDQMTEDLESYLKSRRERVDSVLRALLPASRTKPATIHEAMRYSMFRGGKRLRPILCLAAAEACGGELNLALPPAAALECIHTYSLIHDDLPCMDDDDLRRGNPTSHRKYGEGIAVLAGDALLTVAFEILAETLSTRRYELRDYVSELAVASGSRHLIGGQVLDLENEGQKKQVSTEMLKTIHQSKTAALLRSSCRLGAMTANAAPRKLSAVGDFGFDLGLAFQVIDDILDVTQSSGKLGKSSGKDQAAGKATYPALFGLKGARAEAGRLTERAHRALKPLGKKASKRLHEIADCLLDRNY